MHLFSNQRIRGGFTILALGIVLIAALLWTFGSPITKSSSSLRASLFAFIWPHHDSSAKTPSQNFAQFPLFFEPNKGQVHHDVKYLSRGAGYTLFLTASEAVFQLDNKKQHGEKTVLRTRLLNANLNAITQGELEQPGRSNYFMGNQPKNWHTNIENYGKVRYQSVYPGVDLVYYGNQGQLEYDFVVQPGANPHTIRMQYDGAKALRIDEHGNLHADTDHGSLTQYKPIAYQEINGIRHPVESQFVLAKNEVSFQLGDYDAKHKLVIDPVLVYSTFLGSGINHSLNQIAVDSAGNAYISGYTDSTTYPQKNALPGNPIPGTNAPVMAIITKLSADGSTLLYSTYLGGNGNNMALALGVASDGSAYLGGYTSATDFPTQNAFQALNNNSKGSGFLTHLSPNGQSILFSTYLGGEDYASADQGSPDIIHALAVRSDDGVVVVGQTGGKNFPTSPGALIPTHDTSENSDGFISAFATDGSRLFSTYMAGDHTDVISAVALDSSDRIYITGTTDSTNFPCVITPPATTCPSSNLIGSTDAFYTRLTADASAIEHSNYFGGSNTDEGRGIAVNSAGDVWITGNTTSVNFPIVPNIAGHEKTHSQSSPFLIGLRSDGTEIASNILGKIGTNNYNRFGFANAIAIDTQDNIFVAGFQFLPDINRIDPITTPAFPVIPSGQETLFMSSFISKFQPDGVTPIYSTDLRGNGTEINPLSADGGVRSIRVDHTGALYAAGTTQSANFPTVNAYTPTAPGASGEWNGFVAKIGKGPTITMSVSPRVIASGGNATLTWHASNDAVSCKSSGYPSFSNDPELTTGTLPITESLVGDHVYSLACTDNDGNTSTAFATLHVAGPPTLVMGFDTSQVIVNQSSQLTWNAVDADTCQGIAPASFVGTLNTTGSTSVDSASPASLTYTIQCDGVAGSVTQSATLTVHAKPTVTLTPHTSQPGYAFAGETMTWDWTSTDTVSCEATGDVTGTGLSPTGSLPLLVNSAGSRTVTLTCTGPTGVTATSTQSVSVYDQNTPPSITLTSNRAPSNTILGKQTVMLSWTTSNASSCAASTSNTARPEASWTGTKAISGSTEISPTEPASGYGGSTTYTLSCSRPGTGSATHAEAVTITVNYPRPTHSAWLDPASIQVKKEFVLNWSSTDAIACEASGSDVIGTTPLVLGPNGSTTLTAPETVGNYRIWLRCKNINGLWDNSTEHSLTVTPKPAPPTIEEKASGPIDFFLIGGIGLLGLRLRKRS